MRLADALRWLTVALLGLALLALARLPFAQSCSDGPGLAEACVGESAVQSEGWRTVLIFMLPPLVLAAGAALSRNKNLTIVASAVIFGLAVIGLASVGLVLIPAALTSFLAVVRSVPSHPRSQPPSPK